MSKLDTVTMTGADDSIDPLALLDISRKYPFVEWGILISQSQTGTYRFPSHLWIRQLLLYSGLRLSLHVCGRWVRQLLMGENEIPISLLHTFDRIQLNFHAEQTPCNPVRFARSLNSITPPRQFIFQIDDGLGNKHMQSALEEEVHNCVALFDISGGAGILPDKWPEPIYMSDGEHYNYHGYAGGLGPDNLEEQLPKIITASKGAPIWIDMETKIRSNSNLQFDLNKVTKCLDIAAPFIKQTT